MTGLFAVLASMVAVWLQRVECVGFKAMDRLRVAGVY